MSSAVDPHAPLAGDGTTAIQAAKVVVGRRLIVDLTLLLCWIATTDWLLYRIGTFVGWSLFLAVAVAFLGLARWLTANEFAESDCKTKRFTSLAIGAALLCLAARLVWCGDWLQVAAGLLLIGCYVMALSGTPPFLFELIAFMANAVAGAVQRVSRFRLTGINEQANAMRPAFGAQFLLPIGVVLLFGTIFVMANPNVTRWTATQIRIAFDSLNSLLSDFGLGEAGVWILSGWLLLGMLYPARRWLMREAAPDSLGKNTPTRLYQPYRNTLWSVNFLFAGYLAFEFSTLWFRTFPENFYYAGYAHQGAFWLTIALALATAVLSVIFQGETLGDPRLGTLKRLAIVWAMLNLLLAVAVYNRLNIYISFNGMTRMRVVGLLGTTSVAGGLLLVVVKLWKDRGFVWLLHRQLWVPILAIIAYAILPVDWLVNRYNSWQTQSGNTACVVQVIAHRTSAEGILPLVELADHPNETVRSGVRALLAIWAQELELPAVTPPDPNAISINGVSWQSPLGHATPWAQLPSEFSKLDRTSASSWHNFQAAEYLLRSRLSELEPKWTPYYHSASARNAALHAFFKYAYQWY